MPDYGSLRAKYGEQAQVNSEAEERDDHLKLFAESQVSHPNEVHETADNMPSVAYESIDYGVDGSTDGVSSQEPTRSIQTSERDEKTYFEMLELIKKQAERASELDQRFATLERSLSSVVSVSGEIKSLTAKIETLTDSVQKQEKANTDILRDSKNYQATVRMSMQKELDSYHKMHSDTALAPLLTEIANIYINAQKAIGFVDDEKTQRTLTELILETMEELLEDQGVEIRTSKEGELRSTKRCKTRRTIPTGEEKLHGAVAKSHNPSFTLGNLVLVKENIDTYVFDPALASAQTEESTTPNEWSQEDAIKGDIDGKLEETLVSPDIIDDGMAQDLGDDEKQETDLPLPAETTEL